MKVLIFQTAFLGDLVLSTHIGKLIYDNFSTPVSFVCKKGLESTLEGLDFIEEIIPYDKKTIFSFARKLRERGFDVAVSPHRSARTASVLALSRIPKRIGFDRAALSFLYTDRVTYKMGRGIHEVDRNSALLSPLGIEVAERVKPILYVYEREFEKTLIKFSVKRPYVLVSPGSVWATKRWLPDYFSEVARFFLRKKVNVYLIGSSQDRRQCEEVSKLSGAKSLCGRTSIRELLALVKGASLLLSNDSAPVHIASAFNTPTIEIYCSTVPDFGFFPLADKSVYLSVELDCKPCGIHGKSKCPEGHFRCAKDLTPDTVIKAANDLVPL